MKVDPKLITYFHEYAKKIDINKTFNIEKYQKKVEKTILSEDIYFESDKLSEP